MASQTITEPTAISITQSSIRNAMSFSNLLTEPKLAHDAAIEASTSTKAPILERKSTPKRHASSFKNEPASPADTIMSELTEVSAGEAAGEATGTAIDGDDLIEREFTCMNDEYTKCRTGQYTKTLSRKVISDHFGRNKACTRDLTEWPVMCRKHYQRATYNKELWQVRKVKLILRQFDVIENEFPGTTYDITLKKSEEDRLNEFSRKIAGGMSAEAAATAVAPVAGKAFEAPIDVLRELDQYIGKGKTLQTAKDAMDVVLQMLQEKETDQVPSIEFLPQLPGKTPTPKKSPAKTRAAKSPSESPSKGSPRTSARGAIKKTNQKA
ncbi:uncharacterized protein EKO05_0005698 [Ascochyta rabiei]|uniref:Uncharacterized protein n=1 Tax=Didymella rabiei TaxID=5454 RepID=A0A163EK56_DIDRA|nr:uncharacterized protein EKO05_0005698 [Ascochyta rabiei]KZM23734.1 hypothetical protein ST47_g5133 [Ascochyta rabiei]UPX15242.1 hypothetical protein EKO05_0005698 [Ascochyta rabiei]